MELPDALDIVTSYTVRFMRLSAAHIGTHLTLKYFIRGKYFHEYNLSMDLDEHQEDSSLDRNGQQQHDELCSRELKYISYFIDHSEKLGCNLRT